MRRKFLNIFLTVILCVLMIVLGAGIWGRLSGLFPDGDVWGVRELPVCPPEPESLNGRELLADLLGELEKILEEDTSLHLNTMIIAPEEYEIWSRLPEISQMNEEGLTDEEWLLYQKLCWCLNCYERGKQLPDYSNVLSDLTGLLNKLPEAFYTCHFETREDIDAYVEMRSQIPGLLVRFQKALSDGRGGMGYLQDILSSRMEDCENQASEDSPFLQEFERKVSACDFLTEEEKKGLIEENRSYFENTVWKLYESLRVSLGGIQPADGYHGLGEYEKGEEYYDHWLMITTGTEQTAFGMYSYLEQKRLSLKEYLIEDQQNPEPEGIFSADDIMTYLCRKTAENYPGMSRIDFSIETIPGEDYSELYEAFYFQDDRTGRNYIYISQNAEDESGLTLYQTLAHEAFPGHMYSYNFRRQNSYPALQEQLKCMGYSEGWAVYAEIAAAEWIEESARRNLYLQQVYQKIYDEVVLCQIDIGIQVMGWTVEDIEIFSEEVYGGSSRHAAETVMKMLINNPGVYQPYVVGYFELEDLKQKYCTEMGVPEKEFIEAWHSCGQAPFYIVDGYMNRVFGARTDEEILESESVYYR